MNIVVFAHKESGDSGRTLVEGISACHPSRPAHRFRSTSDLESHLKTSGKRGGKEILILLAESRERLKALLRFDALLEDRRLILVVPDEAPGTLSSAHRLFPRFVTPMADQYDDLCSVIRRMMAGAGGF